MPAELARVMIGFTQAAHWVDLSRSPVHQERRSELAPRSKCEPLQ